MRPLVILRPEPGATATARAAKRLGLKPRVMPLFSVEAVEWRAPEPAEFDALLLTSANAVRHGGTELDRIRDLPAHCVGQATAAVARDAGFFIGTVGPDGVDDLLAALPADLRLLHLCGVDRRLPQSPRQTISSVPVYRAVELTAPGQMNQIEGAVVAVHSRRAAARLSQLADEARIRRGTIAIAAISPGAAEAAGGDWERVETSSEPTDTALLALASSLCNNLG